MRHQQYRESILERLRQWRMANVDATLTTARAELRPTLTKDDVDLLFDNWLNVNFDRIEVTMLGPGSHTAVVRPRSASSAKTLEERIEQKRKTDAIASRIANDTKANLYESFASHIWSTVLPNGVVLIDAAREDLKDTRDWYGELYKKLKPNQKLHGNVTTKQLFDLSQRAA
jgi:hypothetical protein